MRFFDDTARREDIGPGGEGVGGVFVEMGGLAVEGEGEYSASNQASHLCASDLYSARWAFSSGMLSPVNQRGGLGAESDWWSVRYDVSGPQKAYVSTTRYSRVSS